MISRRSEPGAVVITGTSSGIGRATALRLDKSGYQVFAGVRRPQDAERLQRDGSERLCPVLLDITDSQQVADAAALVREKLGPERGLQGLINNAGICEPGPIEFISIERFRRQMDVNIISHVAVIQAFLPLIRRGSGRIINVASAIAQSPLPLFGAYVASKCAMEGLSDVLRRELRWWGIPVSVIEPGTVEAAIWDKTPDAPDKLPDGPNEDPEELYAEMREAVQTVMQRGRSVAAQPDELAEVIQKALEARRPRARYRRGPGANMAVMGRRLPEFVTDWFIDKILRNKLPTKLMGW